MVESGASLPSMKMPTILLKFFSFLVSIGCRLPVAKTFLQIQYSRSAMSKLLGCVAARCVTASLSSADISSLKPRSSFTFSATSLMFETPVPNWRRVTFLMFCAQMVGNPVIAPEPMAMPAAAAPPLITARRPIRRPRVVSFCLLILPSSVRRQQVNVGLRPARDDGLAHCHGPRKELGFRKHRGEVVGGAAGQRDLDGGAVILDRGAAPS